MSASTFPVSDECASIMACPALGLKAAWNLGAVRPATVRGWEPCTPVGTKTPLSKQFFSVSPAHGRRRGQPSGQTRKEVNK